MGISKPALIGGLIMLVPMAGAAEETPAVTKQASATEICRSKRKAMSCLLPALIKSKSANFPAALVRQSCAAGICRQVLPVELPESRPHFLGKGHVVNFADFG